MKNNLCSNNVTSKIGSFYIFILVGMIIFTALIIFWFISLPKETEARKIRYMIPANRRFNNIVALNKEFEQYFAQNNTISKKKWLNSVPTEKEISEMKFLIYILFQYNNFFNLNVNHILSFVPNLAKSITLTLIAGKYCVIHEKYLSYHGGTKLFHNLWGYVVIASRDWSLRSHVHHSASHFQSDGQVCAQAAEVFQKTRSRSLVVAGANRFAVKGEIKTKCQPKNALADASHNNKTMFQAMNIGVWKASRSLNNRNGQNRPKQNAFIQWHGMARSSCPYSEVFISAGVLGNHSVYLRDSPVNRLRNEFNRAAGSNVANTPLTDTRCILRATNNVFGRVVNNVPERLVCSRQAIYNDVSGNFIHIEQKERYRNNWSLWVIAVKRAFPL